MSQVVPQGNRPKRPQKNWVFEWELEGLGWRWLKLLDRESKMQKEKGWRRESKRDWQQHLECEFIRDEINFMKLSGTYYVSYIKHK